MERFEIPILGSILAITILSLFIQMKLNIDINAAITLISYQVIFIVKTFNALAITSSNDISKIINFNSQILLWVLLYNFIYESIKIMIIV